MQNIFPFLFIFDKFFTVTEAWVQTVIPSHSQVTEDSLRSNAEPRSQGTVISSVPLPGSVTDYLDETQLHSSHAVKSIAVDEETGHGKHSITHWDTKFTPIISHYLLTHIQQIKHLTKVYHEH